MDNKEVALRLLEILENRQLLRSANRREMVEQYTYFYDAINRIDKKLPQLTFEEQEKLIDKIMELEENK